MNKDLTQMTDLSKQEIIEILDLADKLKLETKQGKEHKILAGKTLAMIFQKASTRTRVSFEVGMYQLGGHALYLSGNDLQMGRGEPIEDTARTLSRYVDGIMIRTFAQSDVEDLAKWATVPVINGLTDYSHPCQVLADLQTIREYMGKLDGVRMAFIGDGNNMCNSLIFGTLLSGMSISVAVPEGYDPHPDALAFAKNYPGAFTLTRSPKEAATGADVVVTDVWASMGQEAEVKARNEALAGYQINAEIMALAKPSAIVQHCLPAKRGQEITTEIFEAHAKPIFDEAENRLHAQKALMAILMGKK
ncbi:MAG: ornithine carbamoyltransferase [Defluviitaleaceae bacterium]|nr:ornithine carbamoyltransferase [Defluviitaleaceae bacterium]